MDSSAAIIPTFPFRQRFQDHLVPEVVHVSLCFDIRAIPMAYGEGCFTVLQSAVSTLSLPLNRSYSFGSESSLHGCSSRHSHLHYR